MGLGIMLKRGAPQLFPSLIDAQRASARIDELHADWRRLNNASKRCKDSLLTSTAKGVVIIELLKKKLSHLQPANRTRAGRSVFGPTCYNLSEYMAIKYSPMDSYTRALACTCFGCSNEMSLAADSARHFLLDIIVPASTSFCNNTLDPAGHRNDPDLMDWIGICESMSAERLWVPR